MYMLPAIIVASLILGAIGFQLAYTLAYRRFLRTSDAWIQRRSTVTTSSAAPPVAIILCLRGYDPSLGRCLDGIMNQAYGRFDLHIVADHEQDPGAGFAQRFLADRGFDFSFYVFDTTTDRGSLKCRALTHVMGQVISEYDYIALIDADTSSDENWLVDLISPMISDESIGITTGNRWFNPPQGGPGDLVRKIWNGAAIVQMWIYNIPWGGSLAIRTKLIEQTGWMSNLQTAFCEDTMLPGLMAGQRSEIARVPQLIVENDESTTLLSAYSWIARQLFSLRHYHRLWPLVFGHALVVLLCPLTAIVIGLLAFWANETPAAVLSIGSLIILQIVNIGLVKLIENENLRVLRLRQLKPARHEFKPLNTALAIILSQCVQPIAAFSAHVRHRIRWRGIDYKIIQKGHVEVVDYQPYLPNQTDSANSIN